MKSLGLEAISRVGSTGCDRGMADTLSDPRRRAHSAVVVREREQGIFLDDLAGHRIQARGVVLFIAGWSGYAYVTYIVNVLGRLGNTKSKIP